MADAQHDRLDSWKDIAAYLNRDVSTVQRWEKREAMPVHRHLHGRLGSVYAFPAELDLWRRNRSVIGRLPARAGVAWRNHARSGLSRSRRAAAVVLAIIAGVLAVAGLSWFLSEAAVVP